MPDSQSYAAYLPQLHSLIAGNLMPFWATHTWDEEYDGFLTRLDRRGNRLEDREKILIMQARMIASMALAHSHGLKEHGYLALARDGFDFLVDRFWDKWDGGFYFSVTRDGRPLNRRKNTDFHAYTLIGLCAFYRASRLPDALTWANRLFDVLESQAADGARGYIEDFDGGDWDVLNADQMNLQGQRGVKTVDMHTNVMEAFTYLVRLTGEPRHREALARVLHLVHEKGIDPDHHASITVFDADWNPLPDAHGTMTTSYGLNVEIAWLMAEAAHALGESLETYRATILGLIDHALAFGFDRDRGGLAAYGPMTGHVLDANQLSAGRMLKPWWTQAECMNALLFAYEWTREPRYWSAFEKLFSWIWNHVVDHEYGDWYQEVDWATGKPVTTDKGGEWKTAFHAGRALIRATESLTRLQHDARGPFSV